MVSKQAANKRKRTSNNLAQNKQRRTIPPAYTNASEPEREHSPASETFWAATRVLQDNGTHYLVEWDGVDPATGSAYEPTWEPHEFVTPALEAEWKGTMTAQSGVARHTQSQVQSYGETRDRARSPSGSPEALTPVHSTVERLLQSQRALTGSLQQTRQSRRGSRSLFVELQNGECELETSDLCSCVVVLASQNNDGPGSYTTTTPKEASGSNQPNSATVNCDGDTDEEELSTTNPAVLVLRHSSHVLPPASIERANSVGTTQQSLQHELAEKVWEERGQENGTPESPIQEEPESLEQAGQEPIETQGRPVQENEPVSPTPVVSEESSKVGERQETYNKPEIREHSLSRLTSEVAQGQSKFSTEAEPVLRTETRRKIDRNEAALDLPSMETAEEQSQALLSSEQPPEGLSKKHEAYEEVVVRHSEQRISSFPEQSELTEQPTTECTLDLPFSVANNAWTEHLAASSQLTSRLEQKYTGEQTVTKQVLTAPTTGEGGEACSFIATTPMEWAPHSSEQVNHQGIGGRLPPPPPLNETVRSLGAASVHEAQHCTRESVHTICEEPIAPVIGQRQSQNIETAQGRMLATIDRPESNRQWTTEPLELPHSDNQIPQHRNPRPMEPFQSEIAPVPGLHAPRSSMSERNSVERAGATELTRAGVQLELKKSKRRFVNRTRTGCITCRRRKKKCDEAKPKCNNCKNVGFLCQGYANKMPSPKNGVAMPLPSLEAQKQMPPNPCQLHSRLQDCDLAHILSCEPSLRNSQSTHPDQYAPNGSVGCCDRPIAIEVQKHQPPALSWETGRSVPFYISYPPEQPPPPASYPHLPSAPAPVHQRDASQDHRQGTHPVQSPPPLRLKPYVYDHTLQSMSQVATNPFAGATEAHQQTKQPPQHASLATPTAARPGPPPSRPTPVPSVQKTEKQKMLDGEPFMPYHVQLVDERAQCAGAIHRFNNTGNVIFGIAQNLQERFFKGVVEATWAQPHHRKNLIGGDLGGGTHVATPFYCDYGYNVSVGDNVIIGPNCQLLDSARITIGRNTKIGARVTITTLKTPTDTKALGASFGTEVAKEVHIGENVHIGDSCIVGAGVRIGNGAIVRSGSVVFHDILPDYIARGNPANMYKANQVP